jgi:hypothetical protein
MKSSRRRNERYISSPLDAVGRGRLFLVGPSQTEIKPAASRVKRRAGRPVPRGSTRRRSRFAPSIGLGRTSADLCHPCFIEQSQALFHFAKYAERWNTRACQRENPVNVKAREWWTRHVPLSRNSTIARSWVVSGTKVKKNEYSCTLLRRWALPPDRKRCPRWQVRGTVGEERTLE